MYIHKRTHIVGQYYILPPLVKKGKKKNIRSMADLRQMKLTVNRVEVWGFGDKRKSSHKMCILGVMCKVCFKIV